MEQKDILQSENNIIYIYICYEEDQDIRHLGREHGAATYGASQNVELMMVSNHQKQQCPKDHPHLPARGHSEIYEIFFSMI